MNTFELAQSQFEYLVDGTLVIVLATSENQALAALRRQYGWKAVVESAAQPAIAARK